MLEINGVLFIRQAVRLTARPTRGPAQTATARERAAASQAALRAAAALMGERVAASFDATDRGQGQCRADMAV